MRRRRCLAFAAAAALLLDAAPAAAQESIDIGEVDTTSYPTMEVVVSVLDAPGTSPEFTVDEGGTIVVPEVTPSWTAPLEVVLAIDRSAGMAGEPLVAVQEAARSFVSAFPDTTRFAVVGIGSTPTTSTDLTADRAVVDQAIGGLVAEGETALYDAMIIATLKLELSDPGARTALVVLSGGGDTASTGSLETAAAMTSLGFDTIHVVSFATGDQDTAPLAQIVGARGSVVETSDPASLSSIYDGLVPRVADQLVLRWDTTISEDATVDIVHAATATRATRPLDLDESLLTPPADPSSAPTATTPTPEPEPTTPLLTDPSPGPAASQPDEPSDRPVGMLVGIGLVAALVGLVSAFVLVRSRRTSRPSVSRRWFGLPRPGPATPFVAQLDGTLRILARHLRNGQDMAGAFGMTAIASDRPTSDEFRRISDDIRKRDDVNAALDRSADRIGSQDYRWVVRAIAIRREARVGLADMLEEVSETIRDRNELRRQSRIRRTDARRAALALVALPAAALVVLVVSVPDYVNPLFDRTSGQVALAVAGALLGVAVIWMHRIVRVQE